MQGAGVNRRLNEILIKENGFSKLALTVSEGESVSFLIPSANKKSSTNKDEAADEQSEVLLDNVYLTQVVNDETEGKYRQVMRGYQSGPLTSKYTIKFKAMGDYIFKLQNHPRNPPVMKIKVVEEQPISIVVTDEGFVPRIIRIDEGTSIKWTWNKLSIPHSIYEAEYCHKHAGLFTTSKELVVPTLTNSLKRKFTEKGVYYFQTEAQNSEQKHVFIVEVLNAQKEHVVEILDNKFSPARITIEEGDKVWFYWSKEKCQKKHCVYQIHPPAPEHPSNKPYIDVKNGFKWTAPSLNGMISHTFDKYGVYYFSDIGEKECASYIGVIAVKKKEDHRVISYNEERKRFNDDVISIESGDLLWLKWSKPTVLKISMLDARLLYDKKIELDRCDKYAGCKSLYADGLGKSGIYSYKFKKAGCYFLLVQKEDEDVPEQTLTVVVTPAEKDHKIEVKDNESDPCILNIHPDDRVWFVWDDTKKPQNVRQVNHQNKIVPNGFLSGALMEPPGTFVESFSTLGVYYYRSDNNKNYMGAIVVVPEPTIQVINVNEKGVLPDPIVVKTNDVVLWDFPAEQLNDLVRLKEENDLYNYIERAKEIKPRRFLSRAYKEPGVYHYMSPSLDVTVGSNKNKKTGLENAVISTVIVDRIEDYTIVLVDSNGFHPDIVNVKRGKSVLFDWRDSNETHNIIHVTMPNDKQGVKIIEGAAAFNSGKSVLNNSFLYTFEEQGEFCVISENARNTFCVIRVLEKANKIETPELVNQESYILNKNHKVFLHCKTPNSTIHYTTDGSTPSKLSKMYLNEEGISMKTEGINIIRAIAFSDKLLTSDIFTSQRFFVTADPNELKYSETVNVQNSAITNEDWWRCIPKIAYNSSGVGVIEVIWETPPPKSYELISHYQIFLNKVSYRNYISPNSNRVIIKGLAGGKSYDITVMVFPVTQTLLPQQSNVVTIKTSKTTNLKGPVISLKANYRKNQITVTWQSIDSAELPIERYELLINGAKKEEIKPGQGIHKITIEGCREDVKYSILLAAIPKDGSIPLISNELEVTLPLDLSEINLPDPALRKLDKDYYDEYIEIIDMNDGSGPKRTAPEVPSITPVVEKPPKENELENRIPKYASYLPYDHYLIMNRNTLINSLIEREGPLDITFNEPKEFGSLKIIDQEVNEIKNEKTSSTSLQNEINLNEEKNNQTQESSTAPETIDESNLPVPKVSVSHVKPGTIQVDWQMTKMPPSYLKLTHFVITLVGCEFSNSIKSDSSYECLMESNGKKIPAVQHCWITKSNSNNERQFFIDGILDTAIYQITVHAVYKLVDESIVTEYKKASKTIIYTALGPPHPPRLRVNATDLNSVTLEWIVQHYPRPEFITGYRLMINNETNQVFEKHVSEFLFTDMQPGRKYDIEMLTLTNSIVGQSQPSNQINLICPLRPVPPLITQLPSVRPNSAVIGWKPAEPRSNNRWDQLLYYKVFVNKKYHGEIFCSNLTSYSYMICDLEPGKAYDVCVQSFCGDKLTHPVEGPIVACIIASDLSNTISVSPTAPPEPVPLRLASINSEGIEVTWPFPQQYGDAIVSGFQLVRNGKLYGKIIGPDVNTCKINDIDLGEKADLQIIALTNHPIGKYTALHNHPNYTMDQPQREMLLNGNLNESQQTRTKRMSDIHPDYPACKPGPVLGVVYTGLVKPAVKVWAEKVTGFSAMIVFQTTEDRNIYLLRGKMNSHFVEPDHYLVSYWPGTTPNDEVQTIKTDKDFVQLFNLKPTTIYTVQVESRKESKRVDNFKSENVEYKYIVYSKSNLTQFQTASPPDPPTNLSIVTTTCHAIKICWDPPVDHGSELIAVRVDCYPTNVDKPLHIFKELTPDTTSCIIDNLSEKTNYRISVTAITEEYFSNHKIKEIKQLPKLILESAPWLPSAFVEGMTSGTDPATNIEWKLKHDKSVGVSWKPGKVYGTNKFIHQILCYQELNNNNPMASQIPLPINARTYKLINMRIGSKYRIWIETVVLIKLNIESETHGVSFDLRDDRVNSVDHYKELKDSRCTNIASQSAIMRVPAPCEPVSLNLTGYTSETIDIYWARPCLYSQHRDPDYPEQKIHLYRHLIGYRLEVNGIRQRSIDPTEITCTLTKCKPLNTYNIVIVALTCLSSALQNTNPLVENEIDINEIDESYSNPLQVKLFPSDREDHLNSICAQYEDKNDPQEPNGSGRIKLDWLINDSKKISQFNVNWFSAEESLSQRRSFDANTRSCYIPVTKSKCIYEINLEAVYENGENLKTETLFIEVPGSPDAPELWLLEQKDNNFTIHWSEPRVYPKAPVSGYQLYLNDVKVGAKIDKDIQKATLPLKPNRNYKINIQALSSKSEYADSVYSNSLNVTTSLINANQFINSNSIEMLTQKGSIIDYEAKNGSSQADSQVVQLKKFYEHENNYELSGEQTIPVKVNKIADDYVEIDWSKYSKQDGLQEYKVEWHCLNTNEHLENRLASTVLNYRIKRLKSGYTYCIKVSAMKNANTIVNRSKNILVELNASPDAPVLKLRACNYKYITMEWNKPKSYGETSIIAYKLYVDGKTEAILSADQNIFTLSKGKSGHEYTFQVQAMTAEEHVSSPLSATLVVIWPGITVPNIRQIENENGLLRLGWDEPVITGNMKISYFRVLAESQETGEIVVQGPFDSNIRECDFHGLERGKYKIHLEITAYGLAEPFCSNAIFVDFGSRPEAPYLNVQISGQEQRKKLDRIAASLANKRDRLVKTIHLNKNKDANKSVLPKSIALLRQIDEALNDCLKLIANYSGYFIANLSWSCNQTNQMTKIIGFRVYINNRQYGGDLHESIRSIRVKLSLEKAVHSIYVTAFTDRVNQESQSSNVIELLSEDFFPFSYYCYHSIHLKNTSWPETGCCAYQDTLPIERVNLGRSKEPIHIGLVSEPVQAYKCEVLDLVSSKIRNLVESKNKSGKMNVILFWTKWCLPSIRTLNYFVMYAKRNSSQAEFTACHCGHENSGEMLDLLGRGGYLDSNISFVNDIFYSGKKDNADVSSIEPFDIKGVPTILITNKNGFIIWKGRYCSYDFAHYEAFMHHTMSEIANIDCPITNCDICRGETSIENEMNELKAEQKFLTNYIDSFTRPTQEAWGSTNKGGKSVPRLPKITSKQLVSVKTKASSFNNSARSSSEFGLATTSTQQIVRSYASHNRMRPSSTDSHGFCYYSHKKH